MNYAFARDSEQENLLISSSGSKTFVESTRFKLNGTTSKVAPDYENIHSHKLGMTLLCRSWFLEQFLMMLCKIPEHLSNSLIGFTSQVLNSNNEREFFGCLPLCGMKLRKVYAINEYIGCW